MTIEQLRTPPSPGPADPPDLATSIAVQLAVRYAHSAARAGDLDQAAELLDGLDSSSAETISTLDLRARVHAQRGEFAEADRCWAAVARLAPDDPAASAGRRTIARITEGKRRASPLIHRGWACAVIAVLLTGGLLTGGAAWWSAQHRASKATSAADRAQITEANQRAGALQRRFDTLDADRAAAKARRSSELNALASAFTMPGVQVQRGSANVQLVFTTGLFPQSTEISHQAQAMLTDVGHRLAEAAVATTVVGHAVAVPGGPASGGSLVALVRAGVAAQILAQAADLPLTAFTVTSGDQTANPFPDPARNRTVTLVLTPIDPPPPH
jgi:hypothetical protein